MSAFCDIPSGGVSSVFNGQTTDCCYPRLGVACDDTRAKTRVRATRAENGEAETGHDYEEGHCGQSGATHVTWFRGSLTCGAGDDRGGTAERRHTLSRKTNVIFLRTEVC